MWKSSKQNILRSFAENHVIEGKFNSKKRQALIELSFFVTGRRSYRRHPSPGSPSIPLETLWARQRNKGRNLVSCFAVFTTLISSYSKICFGNTQTPWKADDMISTDGFAVIFFYSKIIFELKIQKIQFSLPCKLRVLPKIKSTQTLLITSWILKVVLI